MRSLEENLGKSVGAASRGRRLWAVKYFMACGLRYVCVASCTINSGLRHHGGSALVSYPTPAESSEPSVTDHVLALITSQLGQITTSLKPQSKKRVN